MKQVQASLNQKKNYILLTHFFFSRAFQFITLNDKQKSITDYSHSPNSIIVLENQNIHKLLTEGVPVEYRKSGKIKHDTAWLIDFENPNKNEFTAINQFTIIENNVNKRPDVTLFVNGLPLAIIELKIIEDENATITDAFIHLQHYKNQFLLLFK